MHKITPTQESDLTEVCTFLNYNLNSNISIDDWKKSFLVGWCKSSPNFGFHLRHNNEIVGVIGALYSSRYIKGVEEHFCNITSWCVLSEFRSQSMKLAMHVVSQKNYHFTDLSPSDVVVNALRFLNFKVIQQGTTILPPLPNMHFMNRDVFVHSDTESIQSVLKDGLANIYEDHRDFKWINFLVVGNSEEQCLIAYRIDRVKRCPAAALLYVSDSELFDKYRSRIGNYLLFNKHIVFLKIETRFLHRIPRFSFASSVSQVRMYKSATLEENAISNLYTEQFCLEL